MKLMLGTLITRWRGLAALTILFAGGLALAGLDVNPVVLLLAARAHPTRLLMSAEAFCSPARQARRRPVLRSPHRHR